MKKLIKSVLASIFNRRREKIYSVEYSFVVLTWNRLEFTKRCMAALIEQCSSLVDNYEIIVADNGSTDGTLEYLKSLDNIRLIDVGENKGLNTYKKLYNTAKGKYIIELDDDVIELPDNFAPVFRQYMECYRDYGALSLDVIRNEYTEGAKPDDSSYVIDSREGLCVQHGPAGGWCLCIRHDDFNVIKFLFNMTNLSMKNGEDGTITRLMSHLMSKKCGVIKDVKCLHACGPHYAVEFGYIKRDIDKYQKAGLDAASALYSTYQES